MSSTGNQLVAQIVVVSIILTKTKEVVWSKTVMQQLFFVIKEDPHFLTQDFMTLNYEGN